MIKPTGNNVHQTSHHQPAKPVSKAGSAANASGTKEMIETANEIKNMRLPLGAGRSHSFDNSAPGNRATASANKIFEKVI